MKCETTMEGKEKILDTGDFDLSSIHPVELSQSSEIISLPSANRLAELSLASDLSDSEVENEATVLTSGALGDHKNAFNDIEHEKNETKMPSDFLVRYGSMMLCNQRPMNSLIRGPVSTSTHKETSMAITQEGPGHEGCLVDGNSSKVICTDVNAATEGKIVTDMATSSLGDVKAALQQHCNLLSDRHLLQDLLKSLDDKIEHGSVHGVSVTHQGTSQKKKSILDWKDYRDNSLKEGNYMESVFSPSIMTNFKSLSYDCVTNNGFNPETCVDNGTKSFVNEDDDSPGGPHHNAILDFGSSEQEGVQKGSSKLAIHPRHVNFQPTKTNMQDPLVETHSRVCGDTQKLQCNDQQSHEVLRKLAGLRWSLMGWEDVSSSPPTDTNSSLTFLHHLLSSLQTLQIENKHLKEELTTTLKKVKDLSEEYHNKQHLYEKRETRLIEADRQLGELQLSWASAQDITQQNFAKLEDHCNTLKQENAYLKKESQSLKNEVLELKASTQEHSLMKTQMLETEELLAASKKKTTEVLEENNHINLCLEKNMNYLKELEQVKVPQLTGELEDLKAQAGILEDSNKQLSEANVHLEEEFRMLQEQHKILLKKIVEEQEKKTEAEEKKIILQDEVKGLVGKLATMKTQLHLHYQAQVEDLVVRKSTALQEQLKTLESNLQKTFEKQLNAQAETHQVTCARLQKRSEEKFIKMKDCYERKLNDLCNEMRKLDQENTRLHQQKQGVISAVSSILGLDYQTVATPSGCLSLAGCDNNGEQARSVALHEANEDSLPPEGHSISIKNAVSLPHLSIQSSSSSDTESPMFHEGRQTVRHLSELSQCTLLGDDKLQNSYLKNQKKDFVVSLDSDKNIQSEACSDCQSLSSMNMKNNSQAQIYSSCVHSGTNNCSENKNGCLTPNLCHICKNKKSLDHQPLYPSFTRKIRKASEILQASDLTDEEVCYQDGEDVTLTPKEDEEISRILKELKMQVNLSTQGRQSEAPTHDTSLDQDPASLTLHRLSQVSSVLSQYVTYS